MVVENGEKSIKFTYVQVSGDKLVERAVGVPADVGGEALTVAVAGEITTHPMVSLHESGSSKYHVDFHP